MSPLVAAAFGAVAGLGLVVILTSLFATPSVDGDRAVSPGGSGWGSGVVAEVRDRLGLRVGLGCAAGAVMGVLALWPVAILMAFCGGFVAPTIAGAKARRDASVRRTEAIASWAEQLRDVIGSAAGLQEAISVTAEVAPIEIRSEVARIKAGLTYEDLPTLLRRFGDEVADPAADQVVVSLVVAATRTSGNLVELLTQAAAAARAEASLRLRTEVARAEAYADARNASLIVVVMFGLLLVFNSSYLEPYGTLEGQLVLAGVGVLWAAAVQGLAALARVRRPERILVTSGGEI